MVTKCIFSSISLILAAGAIEWVTKNWIYAAPIMAGPVSGADKHIFAGRAEMATKIVRPGCLQFPNAAFSAAHSLTDQVALRVHSHFRPDRGATLACQRGYVRTCKRRCVRTCQTGCVRICEMTCDMRCVRTCRTGYAKTCETGCVWTCRRVVWGPVKWDVWGYVKEDLWRQMCVSTCVRTYKGGHVRTFCCFTP